MPRNVRNVLDLETTLLHSAILELNINQKYIPLTDAIDKIKSMDYLILVVSQKRGWCDYRRKVITIPQWAWQDSKVDYWLYYLSHEVAHAVQGPTADSIYHGPIFMEHLKQICPPHVIQYEIGYKPESAIASGIRLREKSDSELINSGHVAAHKGKSIIDLL